LAKRKGLKMAVTLDYTVLWSQLYNEDSVAMQIDAVGSPAGSFTPGLDETGDIDSRFTGAFAAPAKIIMAQFAPSLPGQYFMQLFNENGKQTFAITGNPKRVSLETEQEAALVLRAITAGVQAILAANGLRAMTDGESLREYVQSQDKNISETDLLSLPDMRYFDPTIHGAGSKIVFMAKGNVMHQSIIRTLNDGSPFGGSTDYYDATYTGEGSATISINLNVT